MLPRDLTPPLIQPKETVLFIGDSITDATRDRENPESLGVGYAFIAASLFGSMYPEHEVRFLNRGIAGDRIIDLERRWKEDCLDVKPDWISVMVGINDATRRYDRGEPMTAEAFAGTYRKLLMEAKERFQAKFILLEPYVLPTSELRIKCREDLDPKIHALRALAQELGAVYVPIDGVFAAARARQGDAYWAPDGVHPTPAGHGLMARAWLQAVGASVR